jgi:hypothetical protein
MGELASYSRSPLSLLTMYVECQTSRSNSVTIVAQEGPPGLERGAWESLVKPRPERVIEAVSIRPEGTGG